MTNLCRSSVQDHARLCSLYKARVSLMHLEHHHILKLGDLHLPPCARARLSGSRKHPKRRVVFRARCSLRSESVLISTLLPLRHGNLV